MRKLVTIVIVLLLAAIGPNIFPAAEAGYSSMIKMAQFLLLPGVFILVALLVILRKSMPELTRTVVAGALSGALATTALEVVRLIGFHFNYMPGNLPRLMGVLLLDRFAEGPSLASDIAGWGYHFWNGASFGIIYVLLLGTRRRWAGALYGIALGIGFMVSPVVTALGVGYFGLQFSPGFPLTVTLAHVAFGYVLAVLAARMLGKQSGMLLPALLELRNCTSCESGTASQIRI